MTAAKAKPSSRQRGDPTSNGASDHRVPPQNQDAEASLLGATMLSADAAAGMVAHTKVEDFSARHQHIAAAVISLVTQNIKIENLTLGDQLHKDGLLDEIGGMPYLTEIMYATPAVSNWPRYAEIVHRDGVARRLILAGADVAEIGYSALSVEEMQARAQEVLDSARPVDPVSSGELLIDLVDWTAPFDQQLTEAIVDGLVLPGRWTAKVGGPKVGKSTLLLHISHRIVRGFDAFHDTRQQPIGVLYLDGEMGEADVRERLDALGLDLANLGLLYYSDKIPKGDTVQGGAAIVSTATALCVGVVILDGINEFVTGAESDDLPWRSLFTNTIAQLKRAGIAVISSDNTGHEAQRARGSSTKIDKPDAVVMLKRTDNGLTLTTTHRRSSAYRLSLDLAMAGSDGDCPIDFHYTAASWPAGTADAVRVLDLLGVPVKAGRNTAREALRSAEVKMSTEVLAAALRWRKTCPGQVALDISGQLPPAGPAK
jgi:DnaB-like helicase N terminal domain/AAA domain